MDIKNIILTHCRPDHAGSAAELKARTNARPYADDAALVAQGRPGAHQDARAARSPVPDAQELTAKRREMGYLKEFN